MLKETLATAFAAVDAIADKALNVINSIVSTFLKRDLTDKERKAGRGALVVAAAVVYAALTYLG